jgi:hypothetical protein
MSNLKELTDLKKHWLEKYMPYAFELCMAVLATGEDDSLGDPVSKCRWSMKAKSLVGGEIKIIATEVDGSYIPTQMEYAKTRRLMVTVGGYQPVYLTFSNDPAVDGSINDIFVPGAWIDFASRVLMVHNEYLEQLRLDKESEIVEDLKDELLIGVPGFGEQYEHRKEARSE